MDFENRDTRIKCYYMVKCFSNSVMNNFLDLKASLRTGHTVQSDLQSDGNVALLVGKLTGNYCYMTTFIKVSCQSYTPLQIKCNQCILSKHVLIKCFLS